MNSKHTSSRDKEPVSDVLEDMDDEDPVAKEEGLSDQGGGIDPRNDIDDGGALAI